MRRFCRLTKIRDSLPGGLRSPLQCREEEVRIAQDPTVCSVAILIVPRVSGSCRELRPMREPRTDCPDAIAPARVIDWHVRPPPRRDERLCHWPVFPESLASPARALPVAAEASSPRVMLVVDEPRPAARLHSTWNVRLAASNMTILYCCPRSPPRGPSAARSAGQPYGWAAPPASPPCPHNGALAPCYVRASGGWVSGWRAGGERRCSRWQVDEVHAWCGRACGGARARG